MTRCDTCGNDLDRMEAPSVNTCNGDFCLICAGREIERLHKLESDQRWRKWPEEKPDGLGQYMALSRDRFEDLTRFKMDSFCPVAQKWLGSEPVYWRPIGELPKEQGEK